MSKYDIQKSLGPRTKAGLETSPYQFTNFRYAAMPASGKTDNPKAKTVVADCIISGKKCTFFQKGVSGAYAPGIQYCIDYNNQLLFKATSIKGLFDQIEAQNTLSAGAPKDKIKQLTAELEKLTGKKVKFL